MNLNQLKNKTRIFDEIFGPNRKAALVIKKLKEEIEELDNVLMSGEDPSEEFADCLIILVDMYRLYYGNDVNMQKLIDDCSKKIDICKERNWQEPDEFGNYKHVKK